MDPYEKILSTHPRLLGFAAPHALREWLQHEGLVVEVPDNDRMKDGSSEG